MSEHTLVLLRHAKSDWSTGEPDSLRPLAERGRRQAPDAGTWLATHLDTIDLAVVSPARRARDTWALVAAELVVRPQERVDDRVYGASGRDLRGVVRDLPNDVHTVVLVGHNPGIEDLAEVLTRESPPMRTSALAVIDIGGPWSTAGDHPATLRASGRPPTD